MKLTDDFFLEHCSHERRVLQFTLYALHLAWGGTIWGKPIKASTVEGYLRAAASLVALHCNRDPRYDRPTDLKMSPRIHAILAELKRVESIPDRMEPYTPAMQALLRDLIQETNAGPDSFLHAMLNWNACNMSMGCRLREYAQNNAHKSLDNPEKAPNNLPGKPSLRAFTLGDVALFDEHNRSVSFRTFASDASSVHRVEMTWSWQKNSEHGRSLAYTSNRAAPEFDFIRNLHEIICRFDRLVGLHNTTTPLAVYRDDGCATEYLHERKISALIKTLAIRCYHLDPRAPKIPYGSHSLRVGACVALHAAGASDVQIQFLLRWKSNAFMNYLRKIGRLSEVQNAAIALAASNANIQFAIAA